MSREATVGPRSSVTRTNGNVTTKFVGTLVQIQHASGQPCAQLVFETPKGPVLALNRNIHVLQELTIGKLYQVEGTKREVGGKSYWHEPIVTPLVYWKQKPQRTRLAGLAVIIGLSIVMGMLLRDQQEAQYVTAESAPGGSSQVVKAKSATPASPASQEAVPTAEADASAGNAHSRPSTLPTRSSSGSEPSNPSPAPADPAGPVQPPVTPTPPPVNPTPPPTEPTPPPAEPTPPPPTDPTPPPAEP